MSYGEGYELFMCPNCESNLYEPGPACMRCGYSASAWLDLNPDRRGNIDTIPKTVTSTGGAP